MEAGTLGVLVLGGAVAVGWQPLQNSGSAGRTNAHPFAILGSPAGAPFWPNPTGSWRDPVHGVEAQENRAGRRSTENRSAFGGQREMMQHLTILPPLLPGTRRDLEFPVPSLDVSTACPLL